MASFAIVEFTTDCSVDVVPSRWLNNNKCFWPPYNKDCLTSAKKKEEQPDTAWKQYEIRVLHVFGKCLIKFYTVYSYSAFVKMEYF